MDTGPNTRDQAVPHLRMCRFAMADQATLLLVERISRPGNGPDPAKFMDVLMLMMNSGRERTSENFGQLLATAGFRLRNATPQRAGSESSKASQPDLR